MNKKMSVLGILLMAVVVTSYSVSGTYAKYVSDVSVADEARVAKWQIGLAKDSMQTMDLFKSSYTYGENGVVVKALNDANAKTNKLVAPGTKGQYTFALTGIVETNYTIDVAIVDEKTGNTVVLTEQELNPESATNDVAYNPLKFYLSSDSTVNIDDVANDDLLTFEQLKTALTNLYKDEAGNKIVYKPGKVSKTNTTQTIYWKWDFSTGTENDKLDTKLGQAIAADVTSKTVKLGLKITAEQTNEKATTVETTPEPPVVSGPTE